MDRETLLAHWQKRQARLAELFRELGATDSDYRVDETKQQFLLVDKKTGDPLVAAKALAILSYSRSSSSILMAWANESVPKKAAIKKQKGVPDYVPETTEQEAWFLSMLAAYSAKAEYLYRTPSPQLLVFYALWDVRRAGAGDRFVGNSPRSFVVSLLEQLELLLDDEITPQTKKIFRNQGAVVEKHGELFPGEKKLQALLAETGSAIQRVGDTLKAGKPLPASRRKEGKAALRALAKRWKTVRIRR